MKLSHIATAAFSVFMLSASGQVLASSENPDCKSLWPNKKIECLQEEITKNQSRVGALSSRVRSLKNKVGSLQSKVTELQETVSLLQSQVAVKADKTELSNKADKSVLSTKADKSELASKADKSDVANAASNSGASLIGQKIRIKSDAGDCLTIKDNTISLAACGTGGASSFVLEQ